MIASNLSVAVIVEAAAEVFGISAFDICSPRRIVPGPAARFCVVGLALEFTGKTLVQIGRALDRDHTTIHNARTRYRQLLAVDPDFVKRVDKVRGIVKQLAQYQNVQAIWDIDASAVARRILHNPVRGPLAASVRELRALAARLLDLEEQLKQGNPAHV